MHTVTLTAVLDPERKIQAIKSLRDATKVDPTGRAMMGLKEAKETVDKFVSPFSGSYAPRVSTPGVRVDVTVANPAALDGYFAYEVATDDPGVPREVALDFLLAVMARVQPGDALALRSLPEYNAFRAAL